MNYLRYRLPFLNLLLLVLVVALATACGGSSSNAKLKRHAYAAQVLEEVSVQAKSTVLDLYRAEVEAAVQGVDDPDERARLVAAARERFEARGWIDAANAVIAAKDAYVRAVLLAAQDERPAWDELQPVLAAVLDAYEKLRLALGSAGDRLPKVPPSIAQIVS